MTEQPNDRLDPEIPHPEVPVSSEGDPAAVPADDDVDATAEPAAPEVDETPDREA